MGGSWWQGCSPVKRVVGQARHLARMFAWDAVMLGHLFHRGALLDGKLATGRGLRRSSARSAMMPSRTPAAE